MRKRPWGLVAVFISLVCFSSALACLSVNENPERPTGTWILSVADGSTFVLDIEDKGLKWTSSYPGLGETVYSSPRYEIHDGVLFGCIRHSSWKSEDVAGRNEGTCPFAFGMKVVGDSLTVTDLRLFGANAEAHREMSGTYQRQK